MLLHIYINKMFITECQSTPDHKLLFTGPLCTIGHHTRYLCMFDLAILFVFFLLFFTPDALVFLFIKEKNVLQWQTRILTRWKNSLATSGLNWFIVNCYHTCQFIYRERKSSELKWNSIETLSFFPPHCHPAHLAMLRGSRMKLKHLDNVSWRRQVRETQPNTNVCVN